MKPLELTIYPPIPPDPYESGRFLHNEPEVLDWENARFKEDVSRYSKRLTDPELAAEMWRLAWAGALQNNEDHYAEAEVLERFATLPHYDEELS